jgi:ubiquinol-cytochrome c reductase iron-sulfur subunit
VDRRAGKESQVSDIHDHAHGRGDIVAASADHLPGELETVRPPIIERVIRPQDADPKMAKRAERVISFLFVLSALGTIGFIAAYVTIHLNTTADVAQSNLWIGVCLAVTFGGLGAGIIAWVRWLMPAHEAVQERHTMASSNEDIVAAAQIVMTGVQETGLPRRSLIKRSLGLSLGLLALPPLVILRDLGPLPRKVLRTTPWKSGSPLLNSETGQPVMLGDLEVGSFTTVLPASVDSLSDEDLAKSPVLLIRLAPGENIPAPGRETWAYQDHVAYSKICTHAGCPIGLYQKQSHQLLCPCHQSTFEVPKACKVIFGPAARNLPQLPISVNPQGEFYATAAFDEPIGPSFWERG